MKPFGESAQGTNTESKHNKYNSFKKHATVDPLQMWEFWAINIVITMTSISKEIRMNSISYADRLFLAYAPVDPQIDKKDNSWYVQFIILNVLFA